MGASDPLVSILMPAFNCERFIAQAIRSVINQTYTNWELLICDDGSTDNTGQIIQSFKDRRIQYVGETSRLGAFAARNMLIKRSTGTYVAFLDADDYMDARRIALQIERFKSLPHLGMVGCQVAWVDSKGKVLRVSSKPTEYEEIMQNIYTKNVIGGAYVMIRQDALRAVGCQFREYFRKLSYQDYDLSMLIAEKYPCCNLKDVLYYYRQHASSTSKILSADRLISREVVIHLARQRQSEGADHLMQGRPDLVDAYFEKLRTPYYQDPSLVYRKFAADFLYNRLYFNAIKASWEAVLKRPFKLDNWRTLQYCMRISLTNMFA